MMEICKREREGGISVKERERQREMADLQKREREMGDL